MARTLPSTDVNSNQPVGGTTPANTYSQSQIDDANQKAEDANEKAKLLSLKLASKKDAVDVQKKALEMQQAQYESSREDKKERFYKNYNEGIRQKRITRQREDSSLQRMAEDATKTGMSDALIGMRLRGGAQGAQSQYTPHTYQAYNPPTPVDYIRSARGIASTIETAKQLRVAQQDAQTREDTLAVQRDQLNLNRRKIDIEQDRTSEDIRKSKRSRKLMISQQQELKTKSFLNQLRGKQVITDTQYKKLLSTEQRSRQKAINTWGYMTVAGPSRGISGLIKDTVTTIVHGAKKYGDAVADFNKVKETKEFKKLPKKEQKKLEETFNRQMHQQRK